MRRKILYCILGFVGVFAIGFSWLFFRILWTASFDSSDKADAIVILGAAEYAGKPSPVFRARLDHAYELYRKKLAPIVITTGGKFPGEIFSEGEVGKKYLISKGIPEANIISEEFSLTTKQNIMRVSDIAKEKKIKRIILVSDPFHMYRSALLSRDAELAPLLSPTRTSPISKNFKLELEFLFRETILSAAHILFDV